MIVERERERLRERKRQRERKSKEDRFSIKKKERWMRNVSFKKIPFQSRFGLNFFDEDDDAIE